MARLKDWVMRYVFAGRASTAADADTNEVVVTDDGAMKVELSGSTVIDPIYDFDNMLTLAPGAKWTTTQDIPVGNYREVVVGVQTDSNDTLAKVQVLADWYNDYSAPGSPVLWILTDELDSGTTAKSCHGGRLQVAGAGLQITIVNKDTLSVSLVVSLVKR